MWRRGAQLTVLAYACVLGAASAGGEACEKATFIKRQPLAIVCDGKTTTSATYATYTDCAPTTCVPRPPVAFHHAAQQNESSCADAMGGRTTITTCGPEAGTATFAPGNPGGETTIIVTTVPDDTVFITTEGPEAGTSTLPARPGGDTTVVITTVPGGLTTRTTAGPTAGTTTLPAGPGGLTTVVVTTVPKQTTITTEGSVAGTTTLPATSGGQTTVIVTTPDDGRTTVTSLGPNPGTTTLPVSSGEDATIIVTVPTSEAVLKPTMAESSEEPNVIPMTSTGGESGMVTASTDAPGPTTPTSMADGDSSTMSPEPPLPPTSTASSVAPTETCPDIQNGNFSEGDATIAPWYISNQVTEDSGPEQVVGPDGTIVTEFALIPSQTSFNQVYLNQRLDPCGNPPPEVTLTIRFDYQFTGTSSGCMIAAAVNREETNLFEFTDEGMPMGERQRYEGQPIQVQLTYDSLFTLKLSCQENTPNVPGLLIGGISVY